MKNIHLLHARCTIESAFASGSAGKAVLQLLSAGSALWLSCFAASDGDWPIALIALALPLFTVPLWRGLLWTTSHPSVLPLRPWIAKAIEGMVFVILSLVPMMALWACVFISFDGPVSLQDLFGPMIVVVVSLSLAAAIAQLSVIRLPVVLWGLIALPGLGGALLGVQLVTDGPNTLVIVALSVVGTALLLGALYATFSTALALSRRIQRRGADARPGFLDRLDRDFIRQFLATLVFVDGLTVLGWVAVLHSRDTVVAATMSGDNSPHALIGGIVMILPLVPRFMTIDTQLGVGLYRSFESPDAWHLLPVQPDQLRRRLALLWVVPLSTAMGIDLVFVSLYSTDLGWLSGLLSVSLWSSGVLLVLGLLVFIRLPRGAAKNTSNPNTGPNVASPRTSA